MSKAIIINVETTETTYTATYESGAIKSGKLDKMPGTVKAWIEKHQTETATETASDDSEIIKAFENIPVIDTTTGETITENASDLLEATTEETTPETATEAKAPTHDRERATGGLIWDVTTWAILPTLGAILTGTAAIITAVSVLLLQLARLESWTREKVPAIIDSTKATAATISETIRLAAWTAAATARRTAAAIKIYFPVIISRARQAAENVTAWTAAAIEYRRETLTEDFTAILRERATV